jgi:hypothetical protein
MVTPYRDLHLGSIASGHRWLIEDTPLRTAIQPKRRTEGRAATTQKRTDRGPNPIQIKFRASSRTQSPSSVAAPTH